MSSLKKLKLNLDVVKVTKPVPKAKSSTPKALATSPTTKKTRYPGLVDPLKIPESDPVWGRRILSKRQDIDRWRCIPYSRLYEAPDALRLLAANIIPKEYTDAEEPEDYLATDLEISKRFYDAVKCPYPFADYDRPRKTYCCLDYDLEYDYPDAPKHEIVPEEGFGEFAIFPEEEKAKLPLETPGFFALTEPSPIISDSSSPKFETSSPRALSISDGPVTDDCKDAELLDFEDLDTEFGLNSKENLVTLPTEVMMRSLREVDPEFPYPLGA